MKPKNYPIIGFEKTGSFILDGKMKISKADLSPEYVRLGTWELAASKISYSSETIENKEKSEWYLKFIYYKEKIRNSD